MPNESTYTMKWSGNTGLRERLSIDADGAAVNPASRMGRGSAGGPSFGEVIEPGSTPATPAIAAIAATLPFEPGEGPLAEGTRVGDFRIRGLLGEGAMGEVYLAQDLTLGRRVALKLFKRSVMQDDVAERFLEEARATASFNHPHIVTLHAVGEHLGRPYLALEYIDGESLRARLAAGPLPVREALRHGRAVADATGPRPVMTDPLGEIDTAVPVLADNRSLVLFDRGDEVSVEAGEEGIRFLLVSGRPIGEPVAWYGPIVMNTQEELRQAFEEFQNGTFLKK
jgi:hypothetical protein